jgi:hypothetical protein
MFVALVLVAAVIAFLIWVARQAELFCLSIRDGKILLVRGRIPGGLLSDFADAVRDVKRGTIRGMRGDGGAELAVSGAIDDRRAQRLRNIFAIYPTSRLRAAPPAAQRSFGQLVGVVWLAWLFERFRA